MSFRDLTSGMTRAVHDSLGDPVFWNGSPIAIMVMLDEGDETVQYGDVPKVVGTRVLQLQKADVPAPRIGHRAIGASGPLLGRTFEVIAKPQIDDQGEVWTCEAKEL